MRKFLKHNGSVISLVLYIVVGLLVSTTGGRDE